MTGAEWTRGSRRRECACGASVRGLGGAARVVAEGVGRGRKEWDVGVEVGWVGVRIGGGRRVCVGGARVGAWEGSE